MKNIISYFKEIFGYIKERNFKQLRVRVRRTFVGMKFSDGLIYKTIIYLLLISLGYIYLYPILYMVTNSFMTMEDIIDVSVRWVPTTLNWENYQLVWNDINYPQALFDAFRLAGLPALSATFSSALIGYGFARYNFPFKRFFFALMIMTFIIPPQITMLPTFRMYSQYELLGTIKSFVYPAILGQGLNGAIYILIFYSFFSMIPNSLAESAELDGASSFKIFTRIFIPLAIPSIIIVFLFSFVWYYNETYLAGLFLGGGDTLTLPLKVQSYFNQFLAQYPEGSRGRELIQAIKLAGNVLTLLPLLILYFFTQRHFVESIDRTGITGE